MANRKNFLVQLAAYFWERKAYWLFPVILFLILLIALILATSSPISAFVYPFF